MHPEIKPRRYLGPPEHRARHTRSTWTDAQILAVIEGLKRHKIHRDIAEDLVKHPAGRPTATDNVISALFYNVGGIRRFLEKHRHLGKLSKKEMDDIAAWYADHSRRRAETRAETRTEESVQNFVGPGENRRTELVVSDPLTAEALDKRDQIIAKGIEECDPYYRILAKIKADTKIGWSEQGLWQHLWRYRDADVNGLVGFLVHTGYALGHARKLAERYEQKMKEMKKAEG